MQNDERTKKRRNILPPPIEYRIVAGIILPVVDRVAPELSYG